MMSSWWVCSLATDKPGQGLPASMMQTYRDGDDVGGVHRQRRRDLIHTLRQRLCGSGDMNDDFHSSSPLTSVIGCTNISLRDCKANLGAVGDAAMILSIESGMQSGHLRALLVEALLALRLVRILGSENREMSQAASGTILHAEEMCGAHNTAPSAAASSTANATATYCTEG